MKYKEGTSDNDKCFDIMKKTVEGRDINSILNNTDFEKKNTNLQK